MSTLSDRRLAVLPAHAPEFTERKAPFLGRALAALATWRRRAATRRALAEMSSRMLDDIGLSRFDAEVEASKPFWRA